MTVYGAILSCEKHPPLALVEQAVRAEQAGFEALWVSDHYHPWAHVEQISGVVTEQMAVDAVAAVGSRVEDFVDAVRPYVQAGYDEVYLSQIGPEQDGWFDFWERDLRPALAEL